MLSRNIKIAKVNEVKELSVIICQGEQIAYLPTNDLIDVIIQTNNTKGGRNSYLDNFCFYFFVIE